MRAYVNARTMLGSALAGLRRRLSRDERGAVAVEYVGLAAVAVALTVAVAGAMTPIGADVVEAIQNFIDQVGGGAGAAGEVGAGVGDAGEPEIICVRAPCPGPN
jgi:Flp pilus assembly pilin Flp